MKRMIAMYVKLIKSKEDTIKIIEEHIMGSTDYAMNEELKGEIKNIKKQIEIWEEEIKQIKGKLNE